MAWVRILLVILSAFALLWATVATAEDWIPSEPSVVHQDWLHLTSGEWLWGQLEMMRDEVVSFDSDNLDDLSIDWQDVAGIRSGRILTYVLVDGRELTGTSTMLGGVLTVITPSGVKEVKRRQVHAILEGEMKELNFWSAKMAAHFKIFKGNTDQKGFGSTVIMKREAAFSRFDFKLQNNRGMVDGVETIRNHRYYGSWKIFLSRKFFVTPVQAELYSDSFKNIDSRINFGSALGYFIRRDDDVDWYVELGGSWEDTKHLSVQPGENESYSNWTIPVKTSLETDLTNSIELTAEYGLRFGLGDHGGNVHHAQLLFEFDLLGDLDFEFSFTWDRISNPKEDQEGNTPRKDDYVMAYGLSLDL